MNGMILGSIPFVSESSSELLDISVTVVLVFFVLGLTTIGIHFARYGGDMVQKYFYEQQKDEELKQRVKNYVY